MALTVYDQTGTLTLADQGSLPPTTEATNIKITTATATAQGGALVVVDSDRPGVVSPVSELVTSASTSFSH